MYKLKLACRNTEATMEFRMDCAFVIIVNANDMKVNNLADKLANQSQFANVNRISKLDNTASISGTFIKGYNLIEAKIQFAKCFEKIYC